MKKLLDEPHKGTLAGAVWKGLKQKAHHAWMYVKGGASKLKSMVFGGNAGVDKEKEEDVDRKVGRGGAEETKQLFLRDFVCAALRQRPPFTHSQVAQAFSAHDRPRFR